MQAPPQGTFCSDTGYLQQWDGTQYTLYSLDLVTGDKSPIGPLGKTNSYNPSLGYSMLDGKLYAFQSTAKQLLRIDSETGNFTYTPITGMPTAGAAMAATSTDGSQLYVFDHNVPTLYVVDIDTDSPTYSSVVKTVPVSEVHGSGDFTFHYGDGQLYTAAADGTLWRLDPETGDWTDLGAQLPSDGASGTYQVFGDTMGNLYFYANAGGGIYQLDLTASTEESPITEGQIGDPVRIGSTTSAANADAAGCLRPYDFGDAPDSYGTLKASDGAQVIANKELTLGDEVTAERDALADPDGTKDADDALTQAPPVVSGAGEYAVTVPVNNATGKGATLSGWVDFNRNGTFDQGERAITEVSDGATSATLKWPSPSGLSAGDTFLRLRLHGTPAKVSAEPAEPTGYYNGPGEVEDHPVKIIDRSVEITKTADNPEPKPGDTVNYTVTAANTGSEPVTAGELTDDLTQALDDATYNGDAQADSGDVSYAEPKLSWTGDIPAGGKVTITYSVTVKDPVAGDGTMANAVTSTIPGNNCPEGSTDPKCRTEQPIPALEIAKTADKKDAAPGDTVAYTVTVKNTGQADYTGATVTDDLTGVLDDATYGGDAAADSGDVSYAEPKLSWTGDIPKGGEVTITYTVKVNDPVGGDSSLENTVTGPPGSNCPEGSKEPECSPKVPVKSLVIVKKATPAKPGLGDTIDYTVTVTNNGKAAYPGATVTDDLTDVLDDATYSGDAAADSGDVSYAEPNLTWSGDLAVGASATLTYSVKVNSPATGDGSYVNGVTGPPGSNCAPGSDDPRCTVPLPSPDYDFGDAPDSYRTTLAEGGPYHRIVPGLHIGADVEPDRDGSPSQGADADELEDGLSEPLVVRPAEAAEVTVPVRNTTGRDAVLAGWVDLDGNGRFDAGEQATATVPDGTTSAGLVWEDTGSAKAGDTYVRLRLYGDEDRATRALRAAKARDVVPPSPDGPGGPGEIEDHTARVEAPAPGAEADLEIVKSAPADVVRPGEPFDYLLTVTNHGPDVARDAKVTDTLPGPIGFVSSEDGCTAEGRTVGCPVAGELPVGGKASVRITVRLSQGYAGDGSDLVNTAEVTSSTPDPKRDNNKDRARVLVDSCDPKSGRGCAPDKDEDRDKDKDKSEVAPDKDRARAAVLEPAGAALAATGFGGGLLGLVSVSVGVLTAGAVLVRAGRGFRARR